MNFAIIVASARARSGKTLLSRLLAEHFILGGQQPVIYETDVTAAPLAARFPNDALALDVERVTDQMALFDGMSAPGPDARILDLSNASSKKFFDLMVESDFVREARANELESIVFYIAGLEQEEFEHANELRLRVGNCPFVLVDNVALGEVKQSLFGSAEYRSLADLPFRMLMPALDPFYMELLEEPDVSISEFIREPTLKMAPETRAAIRSWLVKVLAEIYRVLGGIEHRHQLPPVRR
jgi:hypothetical protein